MSDQRVLDEPGIPAHALLVHTGTMRPTSTSMETTVCTVLTYCSTMASSTSGSALDVIFADKQLFEAHFGFSCEEVVLDSDESDLEVDLSEDHSNGGNGISLQMTIN